MKKYLSSQPILVKPKDRDELFLYLAMSEVVVSVVLVREDEGQQRPVYYINKILVEAKTRYPDVYKLALALVTIARKLRPYFQSYSVIMVTASPMRVVLHKPEKSERMAKWTIELSEFDITYRPRTALKSQILADFVVEFTTEVDKWNSVQIPATWGLMVGELSNSRGSGVGILLTVPNGEQIEQSFRLGFKASNNEVEYEAVIAEYELALSMGAKNK